MKNAPKSLGPLGPVISKPKFEAGVLVGCTIVKDANPTAGHALWSTVRTIDAGEFSGAEYAKVYRHRVMRALRHLTFENGDDLVSLCTGKTKRPIERLVVDWLTTDAQAAALAHATALPNLRELELRPRGGRDDRLIQIVAPARLERLWIEVPTHTPHLVGSIAATVAAKRLELYDDTHFPIRWVFERGVDGRLSRLSVVADLPEKSRQHMGMSTGPTWLPATFDHLEATLAALPGGTLSELVITVTKEPLKKTANKARLAAIVKRFSPKK